MPDLTNLNMLPEVDDADRVVGLLGRLPQDSVVRRLVLQVIQGRPLESVQPLTDVLMKPRLRRWREKEAAAWALGRTVLSDEVRDAVASHLMDTVDGVYGETWANRFWRGCKYSLWATLAMLFFGSMPSGPPPLPE